jgi:hypothetical protein
MHWRLTNSKTENVLDICKKSLAKTQKRKEKLEIIFASLRLGEKIE